MLYLIIFIFVLLAITAMVFQISKNRITIGNGKLVRPLAIALLLAGIVFCYFAGSLVARGLEKKQWPVTNGTIVESLVTGEKRAFQPQIRYEFYLDSTRYENKTDLHISGFGNKRSRRDNAKRIAGEYPVKKSVIIYYNPEDPGESYLRTGPYWSDYMKLMVSAITVCLGWFLLLAGTTRTNPKAN